MDRTPATGQRLLFSATLDNGVDVLVKRYLDRPTTHSVDPAVAPVSTMTHHVFRVDAADKVSSTVGAVLNKVGATITCTFSKALSSASPREAVAR